MELRRIAIGLLLSERHSLKQQKTLHLLLVLLYLLTTDPIFPKRFNPLVFHLTAAQLDVGDEPASHVIIPLRHDLFFGNLGQTEGFDMGSGNKAILTLDLKSKCGLIIGMSLRIEE